MKSIKRPTLILFAILVYSSLYGQNYGDKNYYLIDSLNLDALSTRDSLLIDSCVAGFHNSKDDTIKIQYINVLVNECWNNDVWPRYNLYMKSFCEERLSGNLTEEVRRKLKNFLADALNNIGLKYYLYGDMQHALEYYHKSLKISEELNDLKSLGPTLNNLTLIYMDQEQFEKAREYCNQALEALKNSDSDRGFGVVFNNLAIINQRQGNDSLAMIYYRKSLEEYEKFDRKVHTSTSHYNIGILLLRKDSVDAALEHFKKGLQIAKETEYTANISLNLTYLAKVLAKKGKLDSARVMAEQAYQIAIEEKYPSNIWRSSLELHHIYKALADQETSDFRNKADLVEKSLDMYKTYIHMHDSILNEKNKKSMYKMELKHEYEKQKAIDDKENEKRLALEREIEHRQELVIYFVIVLAIGLIVFLIFVFIRLKQSRNQNKIIEDQKIQVEEAYEELNQTNEEILAQRDQIEEQREILSIQNETLAARNIQIMDGINYARNIQENLLINKDDVKEYFPDSFVLHLPKDMVSGDFYWIKKQEGLIYLAVADCTGHGVSAALLSIVCSRLLDKAVDRHAFKDAGKMLDYLHTQVLKQLKRANETVDGMDISLCIFDQQENKFQFSGAHNAAVVIRKKEIIRLEADNRPIGFTYKNKEYRDFSNTTFEYQEGDSLYLFSDGYYDQFGGPKNSKLYAARFDELLAKTAQLDINKQRNYLEQYFNSWRGHKEQIDDICIVGVCL